MASCLVEITEHLQAIDWGDKELPGASQKDSDYIPAIRDKDIRNTVWEHLSILYWKVRFTRIKEAANVNLAPPRPRPAPPRPLAADWRKLSHTKYWCAQYSTQREYESVI